MADAGGMYIPLRVMEGILDRIDSEELASTAEVCGALKKAHERYGEYAAGWAFHRLEELLGHRPTAVDIEAPSKRVRPQQQNSPPWRQTTCAPNRSLHGHRIRHRRAG